MNENTDDNKRLRTMISCIFCKGRGTEQVYKDGTITVEKCKHCSGSGVKVCLG